MNKPRGNGGLVAMMTLKVLLSPELLQRVNFFVKNWNVYLFIFRTHYLFIYEFLLFPEVQKCIVFWHCARLFVYLFISFVSRSPEMLCFQALCKTGISVFETDITMSWINTNTVNKHFFASSVTQVYIKIYRKSNCLAMNRVGYFRISVSRYHRYDMMDKIVL